MMGEAGLVCFGMCWAGRSRRRRLLDNGRHDLHVEHPHLFSCNTSTRTIVQETPRVPSESEEERLNELVPYENEERNDDAGNANHLGSLYSSLYLRKIVIYWYPEDLAQHVLGESKINFTYKQEVRLSVVMSLESFVEKV